MNDTTDSTPSRPAGRYGAPRPKVAPFARYKGTSAWRKDRRKVRAYALFRAATRRP
jgi:hypothetical protein